MRYRLAIIGIVLAAAGLIHPHNAAAVDELTSAGEYVQHRVLERDGEPLHEVRFLDQDGLVTSVYFFNGENRNAATALIFLPYDIDFPGGTAEELLETMAQGYRDAYERLPKALREFAAPITVITSIPKSDRHIKLSPIKLRGATYLDLAKKLPSSLQLKMEMSGPRELADRWKAFFSFQANRKWSVYNLRGVLTKYTVEDVLSLLETAWKMRSDMIVAEVKYHQPTKTLHILGTYSELGTASQVFAALPEVPSRQGGGQLETLQRDVHELRNAVEKLFEKGGK